MSSFKILALSLLASSMAISCNNGNEENAPVPPIKKSKTAQTESSSDVKAPLSNVRYYYFDSINKDNYQLIADLEAKAQKSAKELESEAQKKQAELESMAKRIQEKVQNGGYLTQESYEKEMKEFQQKQQQAEMYMANLQNKAMSQSGTSMTALNDSLNNFIRDYNNVNHFDAVIPLTGGGYCLPELDITSEIIEGLNARYTKKGAKAESKAEAADDTKTEKKK